MTCTNYFCTKSWWHWKGRAQSGGRWQDTCLQQQLEDSRRKLHWHLSSLSSMLFYVSFGLLPGVWLCGYILIATFSTRVAQSGSAEWGVTCWRTTWCMSWPLPGLTTAAVCPLAAPMTRSKDFGGYEMCVPELTHSQASMSTSLQHTGGFTGSQGPGADVQYKTWTDCHHVRYDSVWWCTSCEVLLLGWWCHLM